MTPEDYDRQIVTLITKVTGWYVRKHPADVVDDLRQEMALYAYGPDRPALERELSKDRDDALTAWVICRRLAGAAKDFLAREAAAAGEPQVQSWFEPKLLIDVVPMALAPEWGDLSEAPVGEPVTLVELVAAVRWAAGLEPEAGRVARLGGRSAAFRDAVKVLSKRLGKTA